MRNSRSDVIERALGVLDDYGLADLSMRRLATELGLQPSALYHHVASKQELLALLADEILQRGTRELPTGAGWQQQAGAICVTLRDAMLAWRDGAELVSTVYAFGLGASAPYTQLHEVLLTAGFSDDWATTGARTLLHVTFGHTGAAQTHLQAASVGAIEAPITTVGADGVAGSLAGSSYAGVDDLLGSLELILSGLAQRLTSPAR